MSFKRISLVLMVLLTAMFVFQETKAALGSGESNPERLSNEDNRLALNDTEFKKLTKLERQFKSKEKQLQKTKDQIAKLRKSK